MLTTQYLYPPAGSCVACRSSMYSGAVYGALFAAKKGNMEAAVQICRNFDDPNKKLKV